MAGKRGAEVVRDARLGRAARGVEFDSAGEEFAVWFESLAGLEERPRFDLLRCGRTSWEAMIQITGHCSDGGPAPEACEIFGNPQL